MKMVKYILERFSKITRMSRDYIKEDLNKFRLIYIYFDLAISIVIYGCGITDYFQYQFYRRSRSERKTFIVHRKRMWLVRNLNDAEKRRVFNHKPSFNKTFNQYLGRLWLDCADASREEFESFLVQTGKFLVKPAEGSHGIGVRVIEPEADQLDALYEELKDEQALLEELIEQHPVLAEFNPSSVNTLRVVTLLGPNDEVRLMTSNLRLGNGEDRFADNFHHNGIAALLDVESGKVVSRGVDKNLNYYRVHPLSGKEITGFTVPNWQMVTELVTRAAKVVPEVRYVGWDLAIGRESQAMLVEGNAAADPDIAQMPDQVGKWPIFEKALKEMTIKV